MELAGSNVLGYQWSTATTLMVRSRAPNPRSKSMFLASGTDSADCQRSGAIHRLGRDPAALGRLTSLSLPGKPAGGFSFSMTGVFPAYFSLSRHRVETTEITRRSLL